MLIHRDALAVSEAIGKGGSRDAAIAGACFDEQGRAVATDGHLLVRFASKPCEPENFPTIDGLDVAASGEVIVPRADLQAAWATMANPFKVVPLNYLVVAPNGSTVTLATSDGVRRVQITSRKIDAEFPKYQRVMEVGKPLVAEFRLDPHLLAVIAEVGKRTQARSIKFKVYGDNSEIVNQLLFEAKAENGDIDGAIMPMRA